MTWKIVMKRRYVVWCLFFSGPYQSNERFWQCIWEIHLPQAQTPRRFPGRPLCAHGDVSHKGQLWAAPAGAETRGGLFSQRCFLAAQAAPARTSLIFGSTKMFRFWPAAPGGRGKAELIPRSVCRDEGMELTLFSNPLHWATLWFLNALKSHAGSFTRACYLPKSVTEAHCSPLQ